MSSGREASRFLSSFSWWAFLKVSLPGFFGAAGAIEAGAGAAAARWAASLSCGRGLAPGWRKPGFWRIAHAAGVPVVVAAFDYSSRSIVIGPAFTLSDDMQADIARIQHWYAPFKGRNHDVVQMQS